jgi:hypothetical protein
MSEEKSTIAELYYWHRRKEGQGRDGVGEGRQMTGCVRNEMKNEESRLLSRHHKEAWLI